nr:lipid droplet-associated hydrolase [Quercus suber]
MSMRWDSYSTDKPATLWVMIFMGCIAWDETYSDMMRYAEHPRTSRLPFYVQKVDSRGGILFILALKAFFLVTLNRVSRLEIMARAQLFDEIYLREETSEYTQKPFLLFFITGNPGLIEYYRDYLSHTYTLLRKQQPEIDLHIYGTSLLGFEVTGLGRTSSAGHGGPHILKDQISHLNTKLHRIVTKISSTSTSNAPLRTAIAGHSVGAWLTLELAFQHLFSSSSDCAAPFEIEAGILLFPTIYDLALSPRGRIAAPLLQIPGLILFLHFVATIITLLPDALLQPLVAKCASMPARSAQVTTAFLRSRGGVYQALHLAKDELAVIRSERESSWTERLWTGVDKGTEEALISHRKAPRLCFYWGGVDGYVAPATRARVIATRGDDAVEGNAQSKAVMFIDEHETNHAFCVEAEGNRYVAEKTAEFWRGILGKV